MAAAELKKLNIRRFERSLAFECNPLRRSLIQRLLTEEQGKPDSAYPVDRPATIDGISIH